ncbi:MAG: extracellular solute-binding protein [Clostridia bacterium]|nr:extracellular solute-binding protein [Clostridia bacterium]
MRFFQMLLTACDAGIRRLTRICPRRAAAGLLAGGLCVSAVLPLAACTPKEPITVWVYSEEYKREMEDFLKTLPLRVKFAAHIRVVNVSDFDAELTDALAKKQGVPDVFMLSPDNICSYVESDLMADVGELGLTVSPERYYRCAVQAASDKNGVVRAVGWQTDPGVFLYRRSMAQVYLGTDKPDEVQAMLSDWDGFYAVAKKIDTQSSGKTRMLAGQEDMMRPFLAEDDTPWVVNDQLVISNRRMAYVGYVGRMAQEHLIYNAEQWSEAWLKGISDSRSVFGYFTSGIGLLYVMKPACGGAIPGEGSYGDWAVIPGPARYSWGGSWLAAYSGSRHKDAAGEFISLFTACTDDPDRLEQSVRYFRTTGEFAASSEVVSQIRFDPQFEDSFIGGQNYYQQLSLAARDIDMSHMTVYDGALEALFRTGMDEYAGGLKSADQALDDFKTSVRAAFPDLVVGELP